MLRCNFVAGIMPSVAPPTVGLTFTTDFSGVRTAKSANQGVGGLWVAMNRAGDYSNGEEEYYSPSTKPMFVMMNIAANNSATPSGLPQAMSIDYVKVTQP